MRLGRGAAQVMLLRWCCSGGAAQVVLLRWCCSAVDSAPRVSAHLVPHEAQAARVHLAMQAGIREQADLMAPGR